MKKLNLKQLLSVSLTLFAMPRTGSASLAAW